VTSPLTRYDWTVAPTRVHDPVAAALLLDFFVDIVGRYHGRPATGAEVAAVMADYPTDGLAAFLVASRDGVPSGCVGVRLLDPATAEITRMYVRAAARGTGGAGLLLSAVEDAARAAGATRAVLNTRSDLVEARALYARHGYREIPLYTDDPYAQHCFARDLA
jgi:GNAT superfamily N-acetyltransferase